MSLHLSPIEKLQRFSYHLKMFKQNDIFNITLYHYFKQRLITYITEYDMGTLDSHHNDDWSDINLRGGILAVEGTECEMIAAMYMIICGCQINMVDTKDHQVKGIDFYIKKHCWKLPYSVSIKKRPINDNQLYLYNSDFPSKVVDRIIFVDPIKGMVIQAPYDYMNKVYNKLKQNKTAVVCIDNLVDNNVYKTNDIKQHFEVIDA